MNERIRELMVKANQFAEENYNTLSGPYYNWTGIHGEKFAELIVLECASVAAINQAEDRGWDIGEIIKEHFGV